MDYWTRIILASVIGLGIGLLLGYFFGNYLIWIIFCLAFLLATETSLRTIKNVKGPPSPLKNQNLVVKERNLPFKKPPQPKF